MIAHRLSTVVNCDKILVLNKVETHFIIWNVGACMQNAHLHNFPQGKLVESGTHWELLQVESVFFPAI